jgi:hypothetical protein
VLLSEDASDSTVPRIVVAATMWVLQTDSTPPRGDTWEAGALVGSGARVETQLLIGSWTWFSSAHVEFTFSLLLILSPPPPPHHHATMPMSVSTCASLRLFLIRACPSCSIPTVT